MGQSRPEKERVESTQYRSVVPPPHPTRRAAALQSVRGGRAGEGRGDCTAVPSPSEERRQQERRITAVTHSAVYAERKRRDESQTAHLSPLYFFCSDLKLQDSFIYLFVFLDSFQKTAAPANQRQHPGAALNTQHLLEELDAARGTHHPRLSCSGLGFTSEAPFTRHLSFITPTRLRAAVLRYFADSLEESAPLRQRRPSALTSCSLFAD